MITDSDLCYRNFGEAWAATVDYFASKVVDLTLSAWGYEVTNRNGANAWRLFFTATDDDHQAWFSSEDMLPTSIILFHHLLRWPGSRAQIPILPFLSGDATVITVWEDTFLALRKDIILLIGGYDFEQEQQTNVGLDLTGYICHLRATTYSRVMWVFTDVNIGYFHDETATQFFPPGPGPSDGLNVTSPASVGGSSGGSSSDLTRIADALEVISMTRNDLSINHGSAIFSASATTTP